jgi:hypothetical protein
MNTKRKVQFSLSDSRHLLEDENHISHPYFAISVLIVRLIHPHRLWLTEGGTEAHAATLARRAATVVVEAIR